MRLLPYATASLCALALGACGGNDGSRSAQGGDGPRASAVREKLGRAAAPQASDFPAVKGRTLQELADSINVVGPDALPATSVFRPGRNRYAFGMLDPKTGFVFGPTAVYMADTPGAPAEGPYPAPADLLVTEAPFRSRQAATEEDIFSAIYSAELPLERTGRESVLVMTKLKDRLVVAPTVIKVSSRSGDRIPDVGEPAPRVNTDTLDSAGGDIEAIETRLPPDSMHRTNFADVLGRRPVALLFSTPQLCESRVCGPVTDIAEQLKAKYGDRMDFIHQEVFVDNDPRKGLRKPLRRFRLRSEPWLFVMDRQGRVAARLEGSFGLTAIEDAIRKGLAA